MILNQPFSNFEDTILYDCSIDNSRDTKEKYRNHPKDLKIIYNEININSTFKLWQKGIELTEGEWIWIAESDNWCENSFLEILQPVNYRQVVMLSFG